MTKKSHKQAQGPVNGQTEIGHSTKQQHHAIGVLQHKAHGIIFKNNSTFGTTCFSNVGLHLAFLYNDVPSATNYSYKSLFNFLSNRLNVFFDGQEFPAHGFLLKSKPYSFKS